MKETTFDNVKLIHGDCMEYLCSLPDNAFDLAVVDPPYGDGGSELKGAICGRFCGKFENFMGYTLPHRKQNMEQTQRRQKRTVLQSTELPPPHRKTQGGFKEERGQNGTDDPKPG